MLANFPVLLVLLGILGLIAGPALADDKHDSGGDTGSHTDHTSGGHPGSSGSHSDGGHDSGSEHSGGGRPDKGRHGLGGGLGKQAKKRGISIGEKDGHVTGSYETGQGSVEGARHGIGGSHTFGGAFLGGTRHVPEGIGGGTGRGEPGYAGLAGGGRGFGYWGGRQPTPGDDVIPPVDYDDPSTDDSDIPSLPPSGSGGSNISSGDYFSGMPCDNYRGTKMTTRDRITGENLRRLKTAGHLIAPNYTSDIPGVLGFAERYLAYYQEEMDKSRPDPELAGIYLGLIADREINTRKIQTLNQALCIIMSEDQQARTVEIVDEQRAQLGGLLRGQETH